MGWDPGTSASMRARYLHVPDAMLKDIARKIAEAIWGPQKRPLWTKPGQRSLWTKPKGPTMRWGPSTYCLVRATAEDTRFELVRGCPQHAFQLFVRGFDCVRWCPDLRRGRLPTELRTVLNGVERNWNCNCVSAASCLVRPCCWPCLEHRRRSRSRRDLRPGFPWSRPGSVWRRAWR